MKTVSPNQRAFTLLELVVVMAVLGLLATLVVRAQNAPASQARAPRISCISNLKQVGLAFRIWSNDHGDKFPMQYGADKKGSKEAIESGETWRHFQVMSNEMVVAKILVCPADDRVRLTNSWNLTMTNVSFYVGLDADEALPQTLLSGDRNVTNGFAPQKGIIELEDMPPVGWTETIHNEQGNVGMADGSVQQFTTTGLRRQVAVANNANGIGITRVQLPVETSGATKK
jgi:prepilin-type N-terminal cleavage/methylation domain-containing protein/prepilin-type processing-associated H-X9-DG protein